MNRFIRDNTFLSTPLPQDFKDEFSSLMPDPHCSVGSILESTTAEPVGTDFTIWSSYTHLCNIFEVSLPTHYSKGTFQPSEIQELKQLYAKLFSVRPRIFT